MTSTTEKFSQIEVNKAEAQSGSIFKGGWRPAVDGFSVIALPITLS